MVFELEEGYNQDRFTADAVRNEAGREDGLEAQRAKEAADAGVRDARFIGYAEVLALYNQRSDTEPLADRRARHLGFDSGQQDFTRFAEYTGNSKDTETRYPDDTGWTDRGPSTDDTDGDDTGGDDTGGE